MSFRGARISPGSGDSSAGPSVSSSLEAGPLGLGGGVRASDPGGAARSLLRNGGATGGLGVPARSSAAGGIGRQRPQPIMEEQPVLEELHEFQE